MVLSPMMLGAALRVELDRGITKSYGAEVPLAESYINTLSLSRLQVWQVDIRSLSRLIIWALLLDRSRIFFFCLQVFICHLFIP